MTDSELKQLVGSLAISQRETDRQIKETDRQIQELRASQRETDRQLKETDLKLEKVTTLYGNLGANIGASVEEFFYRYFEEHPQLNGLEFDQVDRQVHSLRHRREYDLVLMNGQSVVVASLKHKLHPKDLSHLVEEELPDFREDYPDLADHKLYGAVGSFVISDKVEDLAEEAGVYVLGQSGERVSVLNQHPEKIRLF